MTAVLAFLGRVAFGAVLVLIVLASCLWVRFGPQGAWTLAWLPLVAVVDAGVAAAGGRGGFVRGPGVDRAAAEGRRRWLTTPVSAGR